MKENYRSIRNRIKSMQSTLHTTSAMKAAAGAKLKKIQGQALRSKDFMDLLRVFMEDLLKVQKSEMNISQKTQDIISSHASVKKIGVVVLGSDRGLAGNFNNLIENGIDDFYLEKKEPENEVLFLPIGKRVEKALRKKGHPTLEIHNIADFPTEIDSEKINKQLLNYYLTEELDEIYILSFRFYSGSRQIVECEKYLPFTFDFEASSTAKTNRDPDFGITEFDPQAESILEKLFELYLSTFIRQILLESKASEHLFRMNAMSKAAENVEELLEKLRIRFNQSRQARITSEMIDIINASRNE